MFLFEWKKINFIAEMGTLLVGAISEAGYAQVLQTPDAITITEIHLMWENCVNTLTRLTLDIFFKIFELVQCV